MKIKEFKNEIEKFFPTKLSDDYVKIYNSYDNQGLLVGEDNNEVKKVLCCLDCKMDILDEAIHKNIDLIFTHHPLIFYPIKNVNSSTVLGQKIIKLIKNNICLYSSHLSLDIAKYGVIDTIGESIGKGKIEFIDKISEEFGLGEIKTLESPIGFNELVNKLKNLYIYETIKFYGKQKQIKKVAYIGGHGGLDEKMLSRFIDAEVDCFISAEFQNHMIISALDCGFNLIDLGHYNSEVVVLDNVVKRLSEISPDIQVIKSDNLSLN